MNRIFGKIKSQKFLFKSLSQKKSAEINAEIQGKMVPKYITAENNLHRIESPPKVLNYIGIELHIMLLWQLQKI